ncbi:type VI secretion system baseplate subunit TssG [Erwinia psidii]|uniref:Type VI secretion system baseplate subunit TssG n=2 Tax=Erwinia psidii TaxID=69224 RepID=A0A3N6V1P4_9GAMM|nr:type VI secretion system baseplate subunit TssG [Erwinia psidii]MCX8958678.1 type VI secretion system baseplate subunit TssG [Erwinia psidii]MCX8961193.1 type VI secretion system baseplate subunit TssG [Erwinia psidii]MCX8966835.1 type VI secretion system baseplate subunit TssG [Erwinia psidii]RQM38985.1 type VI secretion system baseplate subunit TssG [Erwinia psidii]
MSEKPTVMNTSSTLDAWFDKERPWNAGFISLMRAIAAKNQSTPLPGTSTLPSQEKYRIGQSATMIFSPREIARIDSEEDKTKLQLFGLGVWGPQGAMPLYISEQIYSRAELHDQTMVDFLDIFHHRALSLFYRAWFVAQDTASLDRTDDERFSFYVASLAGMDPKELDSKILPAHARLASSAHLIREARNPEGLLGALQYYFEVPARMEEFASQWIFLSPEDLSILGRSSGAMLLGDGAILGDTVQDRQHKFKLILGPLSLQQYMRFSPWGQDLPVLREWVRNFTGFEYAWDTQLMLAASEVPRATLGGEHQLGYASWLERSETDTPVYGMSFEPELYQERM